MSQKTVSENYDAVASAYAENLYDELVAKPLDRHLLNRFAEGVRDRGTIADIGCGPGQIARYLTDQGVPVIGIDLSPEMVRLAAQLNPEIEFRTGNMLAIDVADSSLAGIVAFYSIIHLGPLDIPAAFREFRRVLTNDGALLVAFHIGDHVHHVDEMWGQPVSLDFHFLKPGDVASALESAGFVVVEATEREPYEGAEHPSRRCYLFAGPMPPG
ncbi:MAG: methyltransferase domain-containing protein [Gemmatimonadaceae bacterium]